MCRAALSVVLIPACAAERASAGIGSLPFWRPASLRGAEAACLLGASIERLAVLACSERCAPIAWQLDERDGEDRPALDRGPEPNSDDSPGVLDDNDEILWMLEDAGRRIDTDEVPVLADCVLEVRLRLGELERWVYAFASRTPGPPRSPAMYVEYDPERDVVTGGRAIVGFRGATPQYFALRSVDAEPPRNLLDRLKVRAYARFLGLIPLWRNEDDLQTEFVAWKVGPIRVIRRQRQWVRLGWGLRTPIFRNDSFSYRDFSELPVSLRLNFPPTYFFLGIEIQGVLDFRDLRGWRLRTDRSNGPLPIGSITARQRTLLEQSSGDWFALFGDEVTLIQTLSVSPSLATVKRRLVYREEPAALPPEADRGEHPGVGYRLTDWGAVDRGVHWFTSTSYVAPPGYDVERFLAERSAELSIEPRPLGHSAAEAGGGG